jgi:pimeloyl-ACP methyl ester carboxylesterase
LFNRRFRVGGHITRQADDPSSEAIELQKEGIAMYVLTPTQSRRNSNRGIVAGAVLSAFLALALSASTGAVAQTGSPPANTPVTAPKQVGAWTVIGWSQGYCAAERPVRGAAAGGAALQFVLARLRVGYRIALSAPEWDLKPETAFPVQLIADPVLRNDTKAIAVAPKLVVIELGADAQLAKKLAGAPMIEIKAAQATFKLPMEGFADALAAVDACFGSLKQPAANPFAASPAATKQPDRLIKNDGPSENSSNAPAPVASTKGAADASTPVKATLNDQLVEERTFLTIPGDKGPYRLEALVVRLAKADGRLPIALITHGKNLTAAENQGLRADMMRPQARDFAARGWLAVVVIRRGYGQSDGLPGVSRGAPYMSCENGDLVRGFDIEADDLDGALKAVRTRPDADSSRVVAVGQSLGGGIALAFAARRPAGLLGVVNVSGGVWRSNPNGGACDHADLVAAMATFGSRASVPTLWLYSENDSLFPPALVAQMRDAYAQAGGRAELRMFPPVLGDGHALFMDFGGRIKWLRALDGFMQANRMPNANLARVEEVMSTSKLAAGARPVVEEYFSTPMPKLLVVTASGKGAYWVANPNDIEGARKRVLANCREKSGGECTVMMENNELVRPVVTGAITPEVTVR